jgi:AraC-like DNA-binding protein
VTTKWLESSDRWVCNGHVSRRIVCERLQPSVASMVLVRRGSAAEQVCVLPDTQATMVMQLAGNDRREGHGHSSGWLLGAPTRTYSRTTKQPLTLVVTFKPAGAFSLFKMSMQAVTDVSASLDEIWGERARQLNDRLRIAVSDEERFDVVEQHLCTQLEDCSGKVSRNCNLIREICERMRQQEGGGGDAEVSQASRYSSKSERQLRRVFRDAIGLNPHLSWRIERFNRAVRLARTWDGHEMTWGRIAAEVGYFDQAHMNADFREFAGVAPSRFLSTLESGFPHLGGAWFPGAPVAPAARLTGGLKPARRPLAAVARSN